MFKQSNKAVKRLSLVEPDVALHILLRYDPNEIEHRWQMVWETQWPQEILPSEASDLLRIACLQHNVLKANGNAFDTTGADRFLQRLWRLARTSSEHIPNLCQRSELRALDLDVQAATQDLVKTTTHYYETRRYRALIAGFMGFNNLLYRYLKADIGADQETLHDSIDMLLRLLAPAAPHICAELWSIRHDDKDIFSHPWPASPI